MWRDQAGPWTMGAAEAFDPKMWDFSGRSRMKTLGMLNSLDVSSSSRSKKPWIQLPMLPLGAWAGDHRTQSFVRNITEPYIIISILSSYCRSTFISYNRSFFKTMDEMMIKVTHFGRRIALASAFFFADQQVVRNEETISTESLKRVDSKAPGSSGKGWFAPSKSLGFLLC